MNKIIEQELTCLISKMISKYGTDLQMLVAVEELTELAQKVTKSLRRGVLTSRVTYQEILDEVADVYVVLEAIKFVYAIDESELERVVLLKIARTSERFTLQRLREEGQHSIEEFVSERSTSDE